MGEKLKALEAYDLIANIRRLSLDKTENSQIFEPLQINTAHKNLTPNLNFQKANNTSPVKRNSPLVNLATLDENSIFNFNTTTPERDFEANSASPSPGVHLNVEKILNTDQNNCLKQDLCKSLNFNPPMSLSKNNTTPTPQQIIIHAPEGTNDESSSIAMEMHEEFNHLMESIGSQYIEESPNQIRDLTVKLIKENYFRDAKQAGCRNEDVEWKSSTNSDEMRQMMLQTHYCMLYERYKREMHAKRSRVCMMKLNEFYHLKEQCASAALTEKNLKETIVAHQKERERFFNEFNLLKNEKEMELSEKDKKVQEISTVLRNHEAESKNLKKENESLKDTNDKLVNSLQEHQHKLFNLENLKRDESINKKHVAIFEKKMNELKVKMTQIKFQNEQLLQERDSGKTYTKNKLAEYKMFIDSYNDRHTNDAFNTKNNFRCENEELKDQVKRLKRQVELQKETIKNQQTTISEIDDHAKTKLVEAEEKNKSQRQLNQVLQLENFRLEQQLEEITDKMAINQKTFQNGEREKLFIPPLDKE